MVSDLWYKFHLCVDDKMTKAYNAMNISRSIKDHLYEENLNQTKDIFIEQLANGLYNQLEEDTSG